MATARRLLPVTLLLISLSRALCTTFTLTNSCAYTVWPGLLSSAGSPPLATTGFALAPGESLAVDAPAAWSGRVWGRTLCGADPGGSGRFACATGDCGSGAVECGGGGAAPPATLAEFTLDGAGGNDFYDVSLVDGSNLPMVVVPQGGGAACGATGCLVDLNGPCPADLKVAGSDGAGIACRSACEAFGTPEYCCNGAFGTPATCRPSAYSQFFKNACPRAYSYAYDDATSTFTCASGTASYLVVFCPIISSLKSSVGGGATNPSASGTGLPLINDTVSFLNRGGGGNGGYYDASSSASLTAPSPLPVAGQAAAAVLAWLCTARGRHWLPW
uniref:Thaumatin-like protein n=1 Tax=Oryza rufipogon TaxID=4529 RepID=A0A0E0QUE0_ORYRU